MTEPKPRPTPPPVKGWHFAVPVLLFLAGLFVLYEALLGPVQPDDLFPPAVMLAMSVLLFVTTLIRYRRQHNR